MSNTISSIVRLGAALALLQISCTGRIGGDEPIDEEQPGPELGEVNAPVSGMRRLTRVEYTRTVQDLIGRDAPMDVSRFPIDPLTPYDNNYREQLPSPIVAEASYANAQSISAWVRANVEVRDRVVDCNPTGPTDEACMRHFVETFGRRALRRPLSDDEVERYVGLMAWNEGEGDFYAGVELAVEAFLMQPELLFRVEVGTPLDNGYVFQLDDFEVATRLSYLLRGTTPDDALLDKAASGELQDSEARRAEAERLLATPEAQAQIARFHAMWLGYEKFAADTGIVTDMRVESDMLVERVVGAEPPDYAQLLRSSETYVTQTLADHYGMDADVGEGAWVSYADAGRAGILSHGSVLAAGSKANDTSPTRRGKFIRNQLLCQPVAPPPPEVDPDQSPTSEDPNACKIDRYAEHRNNPSCAGCHSLMDSIGFGLENYDLLGRYRAHDNDRPECTIDGKGTVSGIGDFQGPAELGELVLQSGAFEECVAQQALQYAVGHPLDTYDDGMVERMAGALRDEKSFLEMLFAYIEDPAFAQRREESAP
ncbi:MAG: DUF1588 domain-containing protein [Polyangiaceae bacterium]|nr:DUF1588 domain-containing protein [Polyangiaceae bacterium]